MSNFQPLKIVIPCVSCHTGEFTHYLTPDDYELKTPICHECQIKSVRKRNRMFYLHVRSNGYLGNSMWWWSEKSYTIDIRQATKYNKKQALQLIETYKREDLVAYPCNYIDNNLQHLVVDTRYVDFKKSLKIPKCYK